MTISILHTIASIEAEAAGPSYSVPRLCKSLGQLEYEVTLASLGEPRATDAGGYRDLRFKWDFSRSGPMARLGVSRTMRRAIATSGADVFHTHGLWMMPNVYPAGVASEQGQPFMLSPRGMLRREALQFSKLKKRVFWALRQGRAVQAVSCFHATSTQEYEDIRAVGLTQPVAIIPNGIDLPELPLHSDRSDWKTPFVLSLGRIHPIKGLDRLIRGWALVAPHYPQWRLKIVGPDEGEHGRELKALTRELKLDSVEISGPVFGSKKVRLLAEAELFVLSTLSENFGMTVAESLAVGTPAISTTGAPWHGLADERCGWWIDHGHDPMAAALMEAMSLPSHERRAMGMRGRSWMERDFSWDGVARQMADTYEWLASERARPKCVYLD